MSVGELLRRLLLTLEASAGIVGPASPSTTWPTKMRGVSVFDPSKGAGGGQELRRCPWQ